MRSAPVLLVVLAACSNFRAGTGRSVTPVPAASRQLVLVVADDWDSVRARLERFERHGAGSPWRPAAPAIDASVGRNGLAWGAGLHGAMHGRQKREGDGRAPAGVFRLPSAFGYEPMVARLPYAVATPTLECIDDVANGLYNRIVDTTTTTRDWSSSERMRRDDDLYRVGVVVEHNAAPRVAGNGSCIFLHVWRGPGQGTAGCTATTSAEVEALVSWLDAEASPVLVQLPRAEYVRLRGAWELPTLRRI